MFLQIVLDSGGEGIMLNDPDAMYEGKRSNGLLKYKPSLIWKQGLKDKKRHW